jgi:hypothetical protein
LQKPPGNFPNINNSAKCKKEDIRRK